MAFTHVGAGDPHPHDTVDDARECLDLFAEAMAERAWEAECEVAFSRALEARAEAGTWFGPVTWADGEPF